MPPALDESVKDRVRRLWFSGVTRKNIAIECGIGSGSVTNIISELKKGVDDAEYEAIRELAAQLKKEGLTIAEFISIYRKVWVYSSNRGARLCEEKNGGEK